MVCESEYELLEEIGRGSFGKVYKARHDSGEVHAIKVRFRRAYDSALSTNSLVFPPL